MLGASQWQVDPALRLASVGGVWLLSFLVVAVNVAVALLLAVRASRVPAVASLAATAVAASAAWVWAPRPETDGRVRIAVVQPGIVAGQDSPDRRFDREEQSTRPLAGRNVDLVVWGESGVGFDLDDRPDLARRLAALSRETGADVLVNVDARRSDRPGIYKSSVLIGPARPDRRPVRQDAARPVRRVHTGPLSCSAGPPRWAGPPARTGTAAPHRP